MPGIARADWRYEAGYQFAHLEGEAPQDAAYNADLQGIHVAFRENVGSWRGELAGSYQIGSADLERAGQALTSTDETAWDADYRIGPVIAPGVWAFGGIAHRRWESDDLERQLTYSPVGIGVGLPADWSIEGEVMVEYWAVWNAEVIDASAQGALPDTGAGWRVSANAGWAFGERQSLFVNPYYVEWRLDGGLSDNDTDAQTIGINLGLRWH